MRAALVAAATLACGGVLAQPRTGEVTTTAERPPPPALGGNGTRFILYLRPDASGAPPMRSAIAAALATLARIPDARIELYVEPTDRDAWPLAEALGSQPTEAARRAVVSSLLDQNGLRRSRYVYHSNGSGKMLLRRPPGQATQTDAFFALATTEPLSRLSIDDIDALARSERAPREPIEAPVAARHGYGDALAAHEIVLQVRLPLSATLRDRVAMVRQLVDEGRIRVRVEPGPASKEAGDAEVLLLRGLGAASLESRFRLLEALAADSSNPDPTMAVWLLQAAGIDPERLPPLAGRTSDGTADLLLDGEPASLRDLERRTRRPSLRTRLKAPTP